MLRNSKHELRRLEFFPVVDSERETHIPTCNGLGVSKHHPLRCVEGTCNIHVLTMGIYISDRSRFAQLASATLRTRINLMRFMELLIELMTTTRFNFFNCIFAV